MIRTIFKRPSLWLGFLAVFIPLAVLLVLQFTWLASLERTSAIAEKSALGNYLQAVASEVEYFYRSQAERALNVPPGLLAWRKPEKIGHHFAKKDIAGARYLFVYEYSSTTRDDQLVVYDTRSGTVGPPADPVARRAIQVALAPWRTLLVKGGKVQTHALSVDERDPANRMILSPITDDGCTIVGVAGMIVDNDYFEHEVLPLAIDRALPSFFDERGRNNLLIAVRDGDGSWVIGDEGEMVRSKEVARSLPFVFSDWTLMLGSRFTTPEQLAKSNFLLNISLSILLAVALLGGIVLALRTASREMRLSRMKSDFVSNVSHELRTPLASIRVFAEFLRLGRARDAGKVREYGEYIETQSRRLTQLIDNILDFSKIESGNKTYAFQRVDAVEALRETLRSLEVSLRHLGRRLVVESPAAGLPPLDLDPDALCQAVANLVDNAVKYSNGETEVRVTMAHEGDEVVIRVRDQGIGISRDEQQKIFERFHRVSTGLVHDVKGAGLGLSIVHHIVNAHGGRVRVRSESGRGSTFAIHLPLAANRGQEAVGLETTPGGLLGES